METVRLQPAHLDPEEPHVCRCVRVRPTSEEGAVRRKR